MSISIHRFAAALLSFLLVASASAAPEPCKKSDQDSAESARATARQALAVTVKALRSDTPEATAALIKWFGNSNPSTKTRVIEVLSRTQAWLGTIDFQCLYANDGQWVENQGGQLIDIAGELFAYVSIADLDTVYLALRFYDAPNTGPNSKFGTIVHEMTHFWMAGGVGDQQEHYGRKRSEDLAKSSPADALNHGDSYQYLTEDLSDL